MRRSCFDSREIQHADAPATRVLNVCGNPEGLRRLAALLLLCAARQRYDPKFHVQLDREPEARGEPPFFTWDVDVTSRAPGFLDALKHGSFLEWSADVDLRDEADTDDARSSSRPDA